MTTLTDTLSFDEWLPLEQQPRPVQEYVEQLLRTPPAATVTEVCGPRLTRLVRETWLLASAEVLRLRDYINPADHAACMALRGITLILRPRLA